jgi:hypothetical protein
MRKVKKRLGSLPSFKWYCENESNFAIISAIVPEQHPHNFSWRSRMSTVCIKFWILLFTVYTKDKESDLVSHNFSSPICNRNRNPNDETQQFWIGFELLYIKLYGVTSDLKFLKLLNMFKQWKITANCGHMYQKRISCKTQQTKQTIAKWKKTWQTEKRRARTV